MATHHLDLTCPACGEWIEILPTTALGIFDCPWCHEPLTFDLGGKFVDPHLISARPHMEAMLKHAETKNVDTP